MSKKKKEAMRQYGEDLKKVFNLDSNTDPVKLYKSLNRIEEKLSQILIESLDDCDKWTEFEEARKKAKERLNEILPSSPARDAIFIDDYPRGYLLKLREDFAKNVRIYRDFDGCGILAPYL